LSSTGGSKAPPRVRSEYGLVSYVESVPLRRKLASLIKSFIIKEKLLTILIILYLITLVLTSGAVANLPKYVDFRAIALITSLLLISRGIESSGVFTLASIKLLTASRGSLTNLLILTSLITAGTAALVMNDTSLFIYVPLVVTMSRLLGIDKALLATVVTIAANVGSSLTPIGNPQNVIIWQHYGVGFSDFVATLAPFTALGMSLLIAYVAVLSRGLGLGRYLVRAPPPVRVNYSVLTTSSALLVANLVLAHLGMHYFALAVTVAVLLVIRREVVLRADYPLIAMFILMFADFRGLASVINIKYPLLSTSLGTVVVATLLSQVVSNVPATILLIDSVSKWGALAVGVNLGGTGFILGSLANVITIRLGGVSVREFHKYELPYFTILTLATLALVATHTYLP